MKSLGLKSFLKKIIPPILIDFYKSFSYVSKTFDSFDKAEEQANKIAVSGYEDKILIKVIVSKGKEFAKQVSKNKELNILSLRTFIALASSVDSRKLTVIDFGGGAGNHYFIAKAILSKNIKIDWRIVETPLMTKEAKDQGLENSDLKFYDSINEATKDVDIDIVFASSSIHYTSKPYDVLESLTSIDPKKLIITRTPVTSCPTVLLQQSSLKSNGVGVIPTTLAVRNKKIYHPVTMLDKARVEEILNNYGEIKVKIREDIGAYSSKNKSYDMWGYVISNYKNLS